ncbi:hypothetical protein CPC08DRAFT_706871 [Agrocybe pediades]|nr:hypothetical protein CPC08DRAFT_706871 [Agrocybe pediades]
MVPPHSCPSRLNSNDNYPPFPPPNIVLHPDDATSKVFLAVARAFVSVDNRAMTIKDIAERASYYGLACQNLSAAAQAVTTYLRTHKIRCDKQQDVPLLLSHTLSGTPADDDLVPALYSRSGGDSHPLPNRLTNFRKGTAVWYLSRATGVACPFARAGIRLCDYTLPDTITSDHPQSVVGERHSSRRRDREARAQQQVCGQKRKRPLRGCVARASGSDNERPPKVKLTLRLKPLHMVNAKSNPAEADGSSPARPIPVFEENLKDEESVSSDDGDDDEDCNDEAMSVDSSDGESLTTARAPTTGFSTQENDQEQDEFHLPPYPRRSISIPSYTPAAEALSSYAYESTNEHYHCRSPSLFNHFATPPPDSEDESDDFHVAMTRIDSDEEDELGWDADLDSEGELDTVWESPGPRSPSAPITLPAEVTVKEEPRDVQGMLDAWDDFDTTIAETRVADVIAKVLEGETSQQVKLEPVDPWELDGQQSFGSDWHTEDGITRIKKEDLDVDSLFPSGLSSPLSELTAQLAAISYSDSSSASPSQPPKDSNEEPSPAVRPRAQTVPVPHLQIPTTSSTSLSAPPPVTSQSISSASSSRSPASFSLAKFIESLNTSATASNLPPSSACLSPLLTRRDVPTSNFHSPLSEVVVNTCQPCNPAIRAMVLEGISVYQMMLGAFRLLRRVDTDFVNLSPIVAYSGAVQPATNMPNATVVTKGSPEVSGTWVPLSAAQAYVHENLAPERAQALEAFLSDTLFELFPPAFHEFQLRRSSIVRGLNGLNQFGPHFNSTIVTLSFEAQSTPGGTSSPGSGASFHDQDINAGDSDVVTGTCISDKHDEKDRPLSVTEQELFHELCVIPDEANSDDSMTVDTDALETMPEDRSAMLQEPMSPLSPLPPSPQLPCTVPMSPLTLPSVIEIDAVPPLPDLAAPPKPVADPPLRRSKRVASALAASNSPATRTRARKGKSKLP